MAATSDQIARLSTDTNFKNKVLALAKQFAITVYNEDPNTPQHANRVGLAKNMLNGTIDISSIIANGPNLIASNITFDFSDGFIKTDAIDAAISSQIATYWNMIAGV